MVNFNWGNYQELVHLSAAICSSICQNNVLLLHCFRRPEGTYLNLIIPINWIYCVYLHTSRPSWASKHKVQSYCRTVDTNTSRGFLSLAQENCFRLYGHFNSLSLIALSRGAEDRRMPWLPSNGINPTNYTAYPNSLHYSLCNLFGNSLPILYKGTVGTLPPR